MVINPTFKRGGLGLLYSINLTTEKGVFNRRFIFKEAEIYITDKDKF
jgi:hypothetical protein